MQSWDLSSILDKTPILCFVIDAEEKLCLLSGGLASQLQIDPKTSLGKSPFGLPQFPIKRHHFRKAQKESFALSFGIQGFSYETQLSPASQGAVVGLTLDMTKHMQMEQHLDDERHRLLVSQRLNSLAGIAAGLAHEINNPLAIIAGHAELISNFQSNGKLSESILLNSMAKIMDASHRCNRIIESIKTFARDGSQDRVEPIDVAELVGAATELCSQRFASSGVQLILTPAKSPLWIEGRRLQLLQTLFNILQNAFDATAHLSQASIELRVSEEGGFVLIEVVDNGPGVAESIRNKIFEPFFTTKGETRNVGVGLSTAKGIIEDHGGKLSFVSEGGSTRFRLLLPKKRDLQTSGFS